MGVVIDEMVTEIEQPAAPANGQQDPSSQSDGACTCEAKLSRRLHRIRERKLRLSAD